MAYERRTVPVASRDVAKAAGKGGGDAKRAETQLTQALAEAPVVSESEDLKQMADYYRYGKYEREESELGAEYAVKVAPAKMLSPWEEGPASIRVYGKGTGKPNTGENKNSKKERDFIPPYTKFILESIQEGHTEKAQIVETFGEFYVFFYGERPPIYTFSGTLINSRNANWLADFHYYYENYMRGTRCVERNARIILTYGGRQVEGFLLGINTQTAAATENAVPVSFQCLITSRNNISFSDDFGVETEKIEALLEAVAGKKGTGLSDAQTSEAWNKANDAMSSLSPAAGPFSMNA